MIPFLFALALAQADPPSLAPAASAPVDSAPAAASAPVTPAGAIVPPGALDGTEFPKGAPTDDYGLVSWCRGALTGHMALYTLVKPELQSIERPNEVAADEREDHLQMQAGREYLALYRRAMLAAEKASPHPLHDRGVTIEGQGEAIWTAVKVAPARTRMWSWLLWDLPGRCEIAAKRLETRSGLLGAAYRDAPAVDAPAADAPAAVAPTPQPAPADAGGPQPSTAGSGPPQ